MFFSTSFLVVVSFLASTAFSAILPSSGRTTVLVVDPAIDWSNGQFFFADGSVAVETKYFGPNLTLYTNDRLVSTLPRLDSPCVSKITDRDSNNVIFTLFEHGQLGLYGWGYRRPDSQAYIWKPFSESNVGVNTVPGIVSLDTDPNQGTHNAQIWYGPPPAGFPPNTLPGLNRVWTITIYTDASPHVVSPQPFEMVELTYLLATREVHCPARKD